MEQKDKLVTCPVCGGNACYEQYMEEEVITWLCWGCGFTSSTLLTKDSSIVKNTLETSPELYKDLMYTDEQGFLWFPATISVPEVGMIFVDGTSKKDWKWAAVKALQSEKNQAPKMDVQNIKHFERKDFMEAVDYLNLF